jgi:cytochrome P450
MAVLSARHGDVIHVPIPANSFHLLTGRGGARRVLHENSRNYRRSFDHETLKLLLGESILTTHDEPWRFFRRLAQPAFHRQAVHGFAHDMTATAREHLERLRNTENVDLASEMARLTLAIIAKALLSTDLSGRSAEIERAFETCQRHLYRRAMSPVDLARYVPTPGSLAFRRGKGALDSIVRGVIEERRRMPASLRPHDLLSDMLEDPRSLSDSEIRDQLLTLLIAGYETTALSMFWTLYHLARNPDAQRWVRAEANAVLGSREPGLADLGALPRSRAAIEEAMRLSPPVWALGREAVEDDVIDGCLVPAGSTVVISTYALHRRPDYWERPDEFVPERFVDEDAERDPDQYLPFGAGARRCVGSEFAMLELRLVLPMVLSAFELECDGAIRTEPLITLRPRESRRLRLRARGATPRFPVPPDAPATRSLE